MDQAIAPFTAVRASASYVLAISVPDSGGSGAPPGVGALGWALGGVAIIAGAFSPVGYFAV
jgi:hypothetical protein